MDKCRIFSQHFFGVDKSVNYHLLDTDEMMPIKKSKVVVCFCWVFGGIVFWCLEEVIDRMGYVEGKVFGACKR